MMNFGKDSCQPPAASYQLPARTRTFIKEAASENWQLDTGGWQLFLRGCPLLGRVPQAAAFDQAIEIFREICSVVAGALQGLRHQ